MSTFTTEWQVRPSYDRREESHNLGCGGVALTLVLRGPVVVITFDILTDWMTHPLINDYLAVKNTPTPWQRREHAGIDGGHSFGPTAAGVSLHAPTPMKDWWSSARGCPFFDGETCWGDTGYMVGDRVFDALVGGGHEAAFAVMRELHDSWLADDEDDAS